ncbi:uncharacterized protein IL334_000566 [Kwoniella shivajii]|uniref:BAG domain-containing protein n=1 Tax=Kwoniella shivajii TaxID=564305 RepID=A0ABZ1CPZ9_9TREE|nr:hypothetical protein IL334_000566 [Kwoniella shivajii]
MYPHTYFNHPAASYQQRRGFATPSSFPQASSHPAQQFNFFHPAPSPSPVIPTPSVHHGYDYSSIEEEERAALAHLRALQRRREEAQAVTAAREAAIQAEAEARARIEREKAIRAELAQIERQNQIAQAIQFQQHAQAQAQAQAAHHQRQVEQERRKRAYAEAIERKRAEILRAEILRAQLAAQREAEVARQACQTRCQRRLVPPPPACPCHRSLRLIDQDPMTDACNVDSRAPTPRASTPTRPRENQWQDLNNLFGPLFGFQLVPELECNNADAETTSQTKSTPTQSACEQPEAERHASSTPAPVLAPAAAAPASTAETKEKAQFPEDINNLLSRFLGLRVDPLSDGDSSSSIDRAKDNGIPKGLNEFLNQFGLVFEPEEQKAEAPPAAATAPSIASAAVDKEEAQPAPPATTSSTPAPPATTESSKEVPPFTSLLGQFADVNPFLRDLLGNFEHALSDELRKKDQPESKNCQQQCARSCEKQCARKDKGKARAEGERKEVPRSNSTSAPTPTPAPATTEPTETTDSSDSINALGSIESQLASLRSSFTFPDRLAFAQTTVNDFSPPLLFNKINSSYHAQAHALLQLLLKADGISSNGDKDVRRRRKEVVRAVEEEIEQLEKKRDNVWESIKEKRERGEESEPEDDTRSWTESSSSSASSVGDHEHLEDEHIEHAEEKVVGDGKQREQPKSYADIAKSTETSAEEDITPAPSTTESHPENHESPAESAQVSRDEQQEGYTISVTFPSESESPAEPSQEQQAEAAAQESPKVIEEDRKSDKSARVEDGDNVNEEGYEVL